MGKQFLRRLLQGCAEILKGGSSAEGGEEFFSQVGVAIGGDGRLRVLHPQVALQGAWAQRLQKIAWLGESCCPPAQKAIAAFGGGATRIGRHHPEGHTLFPGDLG